MKYRVYMTATVSSVLEVEADDIEAAREEAEMEGLPSLMFVDHTYPDTGDWTAGEAEVIEQ